MMILKRLFHIVQYFSRMNFSFKCILVLAFFLAAITSAHAQQKSTAPKHKLNRAPEIKTLLLDGKAAGSRIVLNPQEKYMIKMSITDPEGDALTYRWELRPQAAEKTDTEQPKAIPDSVSPISKISAMLQVPVEPGMYTLSLEVGDGHGNRCIGSIPFKVLPN